MHQTWKLLSLLFDFKAPIPLCQEFPWSPANIFHDCSVIFNFFVIIWERLTNLFKNDEITPRFEQQNILYVNTLWLCINPQCSNTVAKHVIIKLKAQLFCYNSIRWRDELSFFVRIFSYGVHNHVMTLIGNPSRVIGIRTSNQLDNFFVASAFSVKMYTAESDLFPSADAVALVWRNLFKMNNDCVVKITNLQNHTMWLGRF